jgi:hypothetical protein
MSCQVGARRLAEIREVRRIEVNMISPEKAHTSR